MIQSNAGTPIAANTVLSLTVQDSLSIRNEKTPATVLPTTVLNVTVENVTTTPVNAERAASWIVRTAVNAERSASWDVQELDLLSIRSAAGTPLPTTVLNVSVLNMTVVGAQRGLLWNTNAPPSYNYHAPDNLINHGVDFANWGGSASGVLTWQGGVSSAAVQGAVPGQIYWCKITVSATSGSAGNLRIGTGYFADPDSGNPVDLASGTGTRYFRLRATSTADVMQVHHVNGQAGASITFNEFNLYPIPTGDVISVCGDRASGTVQATVDAVNTSIIGLGAQNCISVGDNASSTFTYGACNDAVKNALAALQPPGRIYGVMGNHDWDGNRELEFAAYYGIGTYNRDAPVATSTRSRASNVATIVTAAPHGLSTDQIANITGMTDTSFNADAVAVTVVNATTFTYASTGTDAGSASDTGGSVARVHRYYSRNIGSHVFFCAYNDNPEEGDNASGYNAANAAAQEASVMGTWLRTQLQGSTRPWKMVALHRPPYNSYASTTANQMAFAGWGVNVVWSGHTHNIQRNFFNGIFYITSARAGCDYHGIGTPFDPQSEYTAPSTVSGHHRITANESEMWIECFDSNNALIDRVKITRDAGSAGTTAVNAERTASWSVRTPVGAQRVASWSVRTPIGAQRPASWSVRTTVGAHRDASWGVSGVLSAVGAGRSASWSVRGVVGANRQVSFAVRLPVSAERATRWNTLAVVGKTAGALFSVRETVGAQRAASWDIEAQMLAVGASRPFAWNVRAHLAAQREALWNVRAAVVAQRQAIWNAYTFDEERFPLRVNSPRATTSNPEWAILTE